MSYWNEININKAKEICKKKNLKPATVEGTTIIHFTNEKNSRLKIISWEDFETNLNKKKLGIFEYKGYMKIMKK